MPSRSVRTWPVMNTVGTLSIIASAIGGDEVGRAGARGGQRHAHLARGLGVALGRVAGALLVAALDVAQPGVVQRVVGGEVGAARDAEYVLDALGLEAFHDGVDCSHAAPSGIFRLGCVPRRGVRRGRAADATSGSQASKGAAAALAPGSRGRGRSGCTPGRGSAPRCRTPGTGAARLGPLVAVEQRGDRAEERQAEADQEPEEERGALDLADRPRPTGRRRRSAMSSTRTPLRGRAAPRSRRPRRPRRRATTRCRVTKPSTSLNST